MLGTNRSIVRNVNVTPLAGDQNMTSSLDVFRFVTNTCIQGPIGVLGLVGNVMTLVVLFKQKHKATTTLILKSLTIADSLYLVCMLLLMSLRYINSVTNTMSGYMRVFPYIFRWLYPQLYVYRTLITWLTVLLTIDRYIVVCRPLHARSICTRKRAKIEVIVVLIFAVIYNAPRFLEYEMTDTIKRGYQRTKLASCPSYVFIYRVGLFLFIFYIIPVIILSIANSRLISTLKRAQATRTEFVFRSRHRYDVTRMVIATVVFFIFAIFPAFIAQLLWALGEVFKPSLDHISTYLRYHSNVSNVLVTLNSGVNFIIYCMCSNNFRKMFVRVFCCGRHRIRRTSAINLTPYRMRIQRTIT